MNAGYLPAGVERFLSAIVPPALQDEILGDLAEIYSQLANGRGARVASLWLWKEVLLSAPSFVLLSLTSTELWSQTMNGNMIFREGKTSAALCALFLLPAALIVIPGLLFSAFGKPVEAGLNSLPGFAAITARVDNPWIVLGGLAFALLVNLIAVARLEVTATKDKFQATVSLKRSTWNLFLLGVAVFFALALFAYLIGENILPLLR